LLVVVAAFVLLQTLRALGHDGPTAAEIASGVQTLQPGASEARAGRLAGVFHAAGHRNELDPLLLVALAFRESSLSKSVENLRRFGALNEIGLMQCHGKALHYRPRGCGWELVGARCQVETGAAYLAAARKQCGGSWYRWVGAYGLGRCPSEGYARKMRGVKNARRYYVRIGGKGWR
jgi:hypothetical protein